MSLPSKLERTACRNKHAEQEGARVRWRKQAAIPPELPQLWPRKPRNGPPCAANRHPVLNVAQWISALAPQHPFAAGGVACWLALDSWVNWFTRWSLGEFVRSLFRWRVRSSTCWSQVVTHEAAGVAKQTIKESTCSEKSSYHQVDSAAGPHLCISIEFDVFGNIFNPSSSHSLSEVIDVSL